MNADFPQILIEFGPVGAGIVPGDSIVIELEPFIQVGVFSWPRMARFGLARAKENLAVRGMQKVVDGAALRFDSERRAFDRTWTAYAPEPMWSKADELYASNNFALRLRTEGPALGVVRRFGERLLFQPRRLDVTLVDYRSLWTSFGESGRLIDVAVVDAGDGALCFEEHERRAGVRFEALQARCEGKLDHERALNLAQQCGYEQSNWMIGFDGVVRGWGGEGNANPTYAVDAYLCFAGPAMSFAEAEEEMKRGGAAPNEAIADLVRNLFPKEWAREKQFLEEAELLR